MELQHDWSYSNEGICDPPLEETPLIADGQCRNRKQRRHQKKLDRSKKKQQR